MKNNIDLERIKIEAIEEDYPIIIGSNGFEEYIEEIELKKAIIKLIENYGKNN